MCKVNYNVYSVEAVANCVLHFARKAKIEVTNLKLQKLVYFVQGFALAELNRPLFLNEIQAWTYGPVIPDLYHRLKHYGAGVVSGTLEAPDTLSEDADACGVVQRVMGKLGNLPVTQLVRLSHMENSPWDVAWECGKYTKISLKQMTIYFKDMLSPQEG